MSGVASCVNKYRKNEYVSIDDAGKMMGCSGSKAKEYLGKPDKLTKMGNGQFKHLFSKKKVQGIILNINRDRKYKKREEYKPYIRAITEMELLDNGEFVPVKQKYKGRVCAIRGCNVPVPTGHYVCPEHKKEFTVRRRKDFEIYPVHV